MTDLHRTDRDISRLHPAIRGKVEKIQAELKKAGNPLEVFEAFRTPQRQAMLAKKRPKVTWTTPWGSIHQYGLAVDFVIRTPNGGWSWDDTGENAKHWSQMHQIAKANGMTPLYNKAGKLKEKPHVQLAGVSSSKLRKGHYPEGGDVDWAEHLGTLIDSWSGPGAPPKPDLAPERPPLDAEALADLKDAPGADIADKISLALEQAGANERFQRFNVFVAKSEGGFVDHPEDKGGPTNMGVTLATLSDWRGTDVTSDDVRDLSREEADAIFWTNFYTPTRCPEMPDRTAMVVYNCAVWSGPRRAVEFIQKAFNALGLTVNGAPLEVDGVLGRLTMGAAKQTDPALLAEAFMDVQEAYLREREGFETFGTGWMNRMGALRAFVNTLPKGAGIRPKKRMQIGDGRLDLEDLLGAAARIKTGGKEAALSTVAEALLRGDDDDSDNARRNKALVRLLLGDRLGLQPADTVGDPADPITVVHDADGKPPLTPVNAALGKTLGRALNGKKSVSGIVGLVLTALLTALPDATLSGTLVQFLIENDQALITLFSLLTGWGFLGKIDKAIRLVGVVR